MSELLEEVRKNAEPFAAPISESAPGGADLSYEPEFDVVRSEIDKLTAMTGDIPDWGRIISAGEDLLRSKTKDMRLLCWVAAAHTKRDGFKGFARGLALISAVCGSQWEHLHPPVKRAKARGNLAGWLGEMALAQFTDQVPKASDRAPLAAVEALFNEVDELLSSKLADAYEGMGAIRSLVRDKQRQLPAETPAQPANAPVAAPSTGQAPVAPAPASAQPASSGAMTAEVPSINSSADVLPALRTLGKGIVEAARHLRQAEPNSAMAYRIQREGVWLAVKQVPPAEGGKTKIPPPQAPDVSRLKGLFEGQQWAALANQAEELTGRFLFWLDLHRYVALGLDRQGANFQEAKDSVIQALLSFLRLHPGVLGLCFADGTPFADEATKAWIEEEMSKGGGGGAGGDGASSAQLDEEEQALRERFSAAREMVLGGKVAEGLKLAIQLSRRSPDARSRFRARLEAAQLALKGAKPEVARALLDGLFVEAETHGLEHWEPELCVQVYSALLKSRGGSAPENGGQLPSNDALLDRLARLDPAAALQAAG